MGDEGQDGAVALQGLVAQEVGGRPLGQFLVDRRHLARGPAPPGLAGGLPLALHVIFEAFQVQDQVLFPQGVLDQIQGKAVGVIELEGHFPGQNLEIVGLEVVQFLAQELQAVVQGVGEALFFAGHHLGQELPGLDEFGIDLAHQLHHPFAHLPHKGAGQVQEAPEADGPAHDAAQHVAPAFVGGQHPVGDQEGGGPGVVGNHPEGDVFLLIFAAVAPARQLLDPADHRPQQVAVEVALHPLDDGAEALQAHAGVDAGLGQRGAGRRRACGYTA